MSGRAIPAAVNWAALLKQTAPSDRKLMAAFKLKVWVIKKIRKVPTNPEKNPKNRRAPRATLCQAGPVAVFAWGRELLPRRPPGYTGVGSASEHDNMTMGFGRALDYGSPVRAVDGGKPPHLASLKT